MGVKKAKLAYKKLLSTYEEGGLNLHDLECKNDSLKVKWVQVSRLKDPLFNEIFKKYTSLDIHKFWCMNLSVKDAKRKFYPGLFSDILFAWSKFNYCPPTSYNQIMGQIIWYNSCIKEQGEALVFKTWIRTGIIKIEQVFCDGKLLPCESLIRKYGNCINVIDYYRLKKAIPKEWYQVIDKKIEVEVGKSGVEKIKDVILNNLASDALVSASRRGFILSEVINKCK